jgi:hypothetical protein
MERAHLVKHLNDVIAPHGFRRRNLTWNRKSPPFTDVLELQVSKSHDAVTLNAGVFDPDVYQQCWNSSAPAFVDEPMCVVRSRIGLISGNSDTWWSLEDPEISQRVSTAVQEDALPFLDNMHSRQAMLNFLIASNVEAKKYPPPIIYLALLMNLTGDIAGACMTLNLLASRSLGEWRARVEAISRSLGC